MAEVSFDLARPSERSLIEGLLQFYIYDFAAMYDPRDEFQVGSDGRYGAYPHLESYWREPDRQPFLIRLDERPAGFALINRFSHRSAPIDYAMAEFFVMRPYRRRGVGRAAAHAAFAAHPGRWELTIAAANEGARVFWPLVVIGAPLVCDFEIIDLPAEQNSRRVLAFNVGETGRGPRPAS